MYHARNHTHNHNTHTDAHTHTHGTCARAHTHTHTHTHGACTQTIEWHGCGRNSARESWCNLVVERRARRADPALTRAEDPEVFGRLGHDVLEELYHYTPHAFPCVARTAPRHPTPSAKASAGEPGPRRVQGGKCPALRAGASDTCPAWHWGQDASSHARRAQTCDRDVEEDEWPGLRHRIRGKTCCCGHVAAVPVVGAVGPGRCCGSTGSSRACSRACGAPRWGWAGGGEGAPSSTCECTP